MRVVNKIKSVYAETRKNASAISDKTGKNRWMLELDILRCLFKYKASPNNYLKFEFYNLTAAQRATYVTYGVSQQMIRKFNNPKDIDVFENKLKFAEVFQDMFGRAYLDTSKMTFQDFEVFCKGKEKFVCKPTGGSQGTDIRVFHIAQDDLTNIYAEIMEKYVSGFMLEEWIEQHSVLSDIYPDAVNCLRIITVYDGKTTDFLTGGVTFSLHSEIANGSQPSIVAPVDLETGILYKPAATFGSKLYVNHPTTGKRILGVQLPFWQETIALLMRASQRVPTVGYVGWDVALTPTGPILIEGNTTPGYKYYQIPAHLSDGIGNLAVYQRALCRGKAES